MLLRFDPFRDCAPRPSGAVLPIDAVRHGDEVRLTVDLPGVEPADVDVSVDRQVLTITATKSAANPEEGDRTIAAERSRGRLTRRLTLGDTVDASQISAELDKGVLTLHLPVAAAAKPRRIEVASAAQPATVPVADADQPAPEDSTEAGDAVAA